MTDPILDPRWYARLFDKLGTRYLDYGFTKGSEQEVEFLLEELSDYQVTIPELGTIVAEHEPYVVLTSNNTREIGDALRRRCLYLYIEHPTVDKEVRIIRSKVPGVSEHFAGEIARFMHRLRDRGLTKTPGAAETIDWATALVTLHRDRLDVEIVQQTLGCILKDRHDVRAVDGGVVAALLEGASTAGASGG